MSTSKDPRLSLDVGSPCLIYSRSAKKWCPGTIHKITIDPTTNKEWLTIKYGKSKSKKMQRFCKDLRVSSVKINENTQNKKKVQHPAATKHPTTATPKKKAPITANPTASAQPIPTRQHPTTSIQTAQSSRTRQRINNQNSSNIQMNTTVNPLNIRGRHRQSYNVGILAVAQRGRGIQHHRILYNNNNYNNYQRGRGRGLYQRGRGRGGGRGRGDRDQMDMARIMAMKLPCDNTIKYGWIPCSSPHFQILAASNIVAINKIEFVIATEMVYYQPFGGIYKYNTISNKWSLLMSYPEDIPFIKKGNHSLAFDKMRNKLYLYGTQQAPYSKNSLIAKIDVKTGKYELIYVPRNRSIPIEASSIIINNQYHTVGGQSLIKGGIHSIFDIKANKWTKTNPMWQDCAIPFGLIGINSENKLFALADCSPNKVSSKIYHSADEIWMHSLVWNKMNNIKLPHEMINFGYIVTFDERYIIIFGGICTKEKEEIDTNVFVKRRLDGIYIFDLENIKMYKCMINCPMVGDFDAVMMSAVPINGARDLVNGYIKMYIIKDDDIWVPMDIVNLMSMYCKNEYIHLMQRREIFAKHWKICLDDILNSMSMTVTVGTM